MTTFREAVYMVLDMLKQLSDDAYYTEEHIMFLLSKARAALLTKKYYQTRNQSFIKIDKANYQEIEYTLIPSNNHGSGRWYRGVYDDMSRKIVPRIHTVGYPTAFEDRNVRNENVSVVAPERLPFVGYNKWLKHSIYCAVSDDNTFFVRQLDINDRTLTTIYLYAIYENALESTPMSSDPDDIAAEDILDKRFPLEEGLLSSCVELVVQELTGSKFQPEDRRNNGKDDMSDMSVSRKKDE